MFDHDARDRDLEDTLLAAFRGALIPTALPEPPSSPRAITGAACGRFATTLKPISATTLGMEALCQIVGVSERTLQTAFQEVTDCSPRQFIKIRRLNTGPPCTYPIKGETSVKAITLGCGFWHMGRFAHDYLAHFGESPSASLARH